MRWKIKSQFYDTYLVQSSDAVKQIDVYIIVKLNY